MVYVVRVACHIYLDIYLDIHLNIHLNIHLDVYLDIHLNVYLNVYRNVHLNIYLTLPPPLLAANRFTTSLLSPSTQSKSIRWSCPPHLP